MSEQLPIDDARGNIGFAHSHLGRVGDAPVKDPPGDNPQAPAQRDNRQVDNRQIDNEFVAMLAALRNGGEEAAGRIFEEFGRELTIVIRYVMERQRHQTMAGTEDMLQNVWMTFFRNIDRTVQFRNRGELLKHLRVVARNTVLDEYRHYHTQQMDIKRHTHLGSASFVGGDHSPSKIAQAREACARWMRQQPERYQEILTRRLHGETHEEIGEAMNVSSRTVARVLRRMIGSTIDEQGER